MKALVPLSSPSLPIPVLVATAGERASYRFFEFFTAQIPITSEALRPERIR